MAFFETGFYFSFNSACFIFSMIFSIKGGHDTYVMFFAMVSLFDAKVALKQIV